MTILHPDPVKIREAMNRLSQVISSYKNPTVKMGEGSVYKHSCGTVACHGGFYLLAKANAGDLSHVWGENEYNHHGKEDEEVLMSQNGQYMDFSSGCKMLAQDIGLDNDDDLRHWGKYNP